MLSIIIPAYNAAAHIEKCVLDLVKQEYAEYEIIIIDDGSSDETFLIGSRLSEKYENVYVFHQDNQGPSKAREYGLSKSRGEYVAFVDADDAIHPNAYSMAMERLIVSECDMVQFGYQIMSTSGEILETVKPEHYIFRDKDAILQFFFGQKYGVNYLWNKVFKKKVLLGIEWPNYYYSEDYAILANIFLDINSIIVLDDVLYDYIQWDNSACAKAFTKREIDTLHAGYDVLILTKNKASQFAEEASKYLVSNCIRLAARAYDVSHKEEFNEIVRYFKKVTNGMQRVHLYRRYGITALFFSFMPRFTSRLVKRRM